jgi:hypothetical protein
MNGENYGASEEWSLLRLLQALASMWSFYGSRFSKGDTSSLWYEFRVRDVDRKALDDCLFLHLNWTKVVMAQDVKWVCCFWGGKKIPQVRVF